MVPPATKLSHLTKLLAAEAPRHDTPSTTRTPPKALVGRPQPTLANNKALVLKEFQNNPHVPFSSLPGYWHADKDIALAAVRRQPMDLEHVAAELRADPEVVLAAIAGDEASFVFASVQLRNSRDFIHQAIRINPMLWRVLPESFQNDCELGEQAIQINGMALAFGPTALRKKPASVLTALESFPGALHAADPSLKESSNFVRQCIQITPKCITDAQGEARLNKELWLECVADGVLLLLARAPDGFCSDKQFMFEAIRRRAAAALHLSQTLKCDADFMEAVVHANPLVLSVIQDNETMVTAQLFPKLRSDYQSFFEQLNTLDILHPARLGTFEFAKEVIRNRQTAKPDNRPLAIVVYPRVDGSGAFGQGRLYQLMKNYRVLYYEAASDEQLIAAIKRSTIEQQADVLILGGHGTAEKIALGASPRSKTATDESLFVDLSDASKFKHAECQRWLNRNCKIVLESCSTGATNARENIAEFFGGLFPQAEIFAPMNDTDNFLRFDQKGHLLGPGFSGGSRMTRRISPQSKN